MSVWILRPDLGRTIAPGRMPVKILQITPNGNEVEIESFTLESENAFEVTAQEGLLRRLLYASSRKGADLRGVDPTRPIHTLAHLQLPRALATAGDTASARKSYKTFLDLVADADPGLPVVEAARRDYAELSPSG